MIFNNVCDIYRFVYETIQQQFHVVRIPQVECRSKSGLGRQASWAVHGWCMGAWHGAWHFGLALFIWGT